MSLKTEHQKQSDVNEFTPPSTPTSQLKGDHGKVTENNERKFVFEIVDRIFDEKKGICSISSSTCSSLKCESQEYLLDKRLKYWKDTLEERKRITKRIQNTVGKNVDDVLFHRRTTVDERDKGMVKRVMDYGERLNPLALLKRRVITLKEYCHPNTHCIVNEIKETLPQAEKDNEKKVEIIGMPPLTQLEQLGETVVQPCTAKSSWLDSEILKDRVESKRTDIERVVDFYPDIDHLQIIGEALLKQVDPKHNPDIELVEKQQLKSISSETAVINADDCKCDIKQTRSEEPITYGIKVNEHVFTTGMKRSSQHVEIEVRFECHPFETVMKRVVCLENIGENVLNIEFSHRSYYNKVHSLLRCMDGEFLFDKSPFRLVSGEKRDIVILYRPRKVEVVKQQWLLKVDPQFFCRKSDAIVLKLNGRCKPAAEYVEKINGILHDVVEKSNLKMMRKLGNNLATITPLIKPNEVICPYRRTLDERELFEQFNQGYSCERYHDLEMLKDIYKRVKKPREPSWDFKLKTLSDAIIRMESPDRRALIFNEMMGILETMKGVPIELEKKLEENPERERSCFIYVRGIICTGIDEWEDLTIYIENIFVKQAVKIYEDRDLLKDTEEIQEANTGKGDETNEEAMLMNFLEFMEDENEIRQYMTKKVRRQKAFRDSLYVQTYTHLCNFIEDIVSVIESTDIV